jgi:hypothetical protein
MPFSALHALEVNWIHTLQMLRTPLVDHLFLLFNLFDYTQTYLAIVYLVYALKKPKMGVHLLWLLIIATLICLDLKDLIGSPRPYQIDPELKVLEGIGYGFPSGAAFLSTTLFGFLFFVAQKTSARAKVLAVFLVLIVGLTRVYLGAHFPSDVIGGYLLGVLLLSLDRFGTPYLEKKASEFPKKMVFFFQLAFLFSFLSLHPKKYSIALCVLLAGAVVSYFWLKKEKIISLKTSSKKTFYVRVCSLLFGIAGTLALYRLSQFSIHKSFLLGTYFLAGMWFELGPKVFKKFLPARFQKLL